MGVEILLDLTSVKRQRSLVNYCLGSTHQKWSRGDRSTSSGAGVGSTLSTEPTSDSEQSSEYQDHGLSDEDIPVSFPSEFS